MATRRDEIAESICSDITAGRLKPGDALPGAAAMATQFEAGIDTVRRTLVRLSDEGVIRTRQGAAPCVSPDALNALRQREASPGYTPN